MLMQQKKQIMDLNSQKWFIFVSCLILLACSPGNKNNMGSTPDNSFEDKNHNSIDSLLNRISNDTIALFNYLSLAQSSRDCYAEMKTYRQLGLYYLNSYTYLKAIQYHIYYLNTAEEYSDPIREIEALNTLAYDYKAICMLGESSEYYFKALSLLNKLPKNNNKEILSEKARTLNGLGNIYLRINQPDDALLFLQKSLQIERQNNSILGQAKNLADIGSSFESRMEYDSAYQYFDRALKLYIETNSVSGMSSCFERIGNLYMLQGKYESASVYIESAYNSLRHTSDKLNWLNSCISFGNICIRKGDYLKAETFLHKGLKISDELKLPNYLEKASMLLSELYKQQGNNAAALEAYEKGVSYAKAFRSGRDINRIMTHRLAYEKKSNETEEILLATQLENIGKNKTKATHLTLSIFIALTGFIIILVQLFQIKKQKVEAYPCQEKIKSDFYANIAHKLKTPVTIITGLTQRLINNLDTNDLHKNSINLDILVRQSQDLLSLIDSMLPETNMQKRIKSDITTCENGYSLTTHNTITYSKEPENNIEKCCISKENPTVLIVENDKDMTSYLFSILQENYCIVTVDNGRGAAQKAAETMPNIIISNITMPGMNGYDLCREIKNSDTIAHIPVILLSACDSKEDRIKGFRCGADAFLSKPVFEEELLAVINQLLDARKLMWSKYALTAINTGKGIEHNIVKKNTAVEFLKQITNLIYKEIDNTQNIIEIISDKICLSSSQLNRKIKAATGMTTSNYILKVRLNKAAQLLSRSQKPIGEIAMNCGFNDFAYFSRSFKKEFGMTPTSFQRLPHSIN